MTPRPCPVCHSLDTGGTPKERTHTGRGRCDIDDWYCPSCQSRWEVWEYLREEVTEIKRIRLKDGRAWIDGQAIGAAVVCRFCNGSHVEFVKSDGHWRTHYNVEQRRYQCDDCRGIWIAMTHEDGRVLFWRVWKRPTT